MITITIMMVEIGRDFIESGLIFSTSAWVSSERLRMVASNYFHNWHIKDFSISSFFYAFVCKVIILQKNKLIIFSTEKMPCF